jgi:hypothetical protein
MKYVLTILFITLIALQTFSKMIVVLDYVWNKDYISKNLCVNRDKPKSCCHGKCYLNKKLVQEDQPQSNSGTRGPKDISELLLFADSRPVSPDSKLNLISFRSGIYLAGISQNYYSSFFHPPRA